MEVKKKTNLVGKLKSVYFANRIVSLCMKFMQTDA